MAPRLALDIETMPNLEMVDATFDPPRQPFVDSELDLSQWKTQEGRNRNRIFWEESRNDRVRAHEEKENARYEKHLNKSLLRAEMGRVLCVAYYDDIDSPWIRWNTGDMEKEVLEDMWAHCLRIQQRDGRVYTASGTQFDIRFAFRRSICLGLKLDPNLRIFGPPGRGRMSISKTFVDVSEVFACGEYGYRIRVNDLAKGMGLDGKKLDEGVTGKMFWKFAQDDRVAAERYALQDAKLAYEMGVHLERCGLWPEREQHV